jgi:anti-sigma factor RsiW
MHDLLHAYNDGELDLVHTLRVEEHLQGCPACARACASIRELRSLIRARVPRWQPSAGLEERIQRSLRPTRGFRWSSFPMRMRWLAAAASIAFVALVLWAASLLRSSPLAREWLMQEVIASHIRSQMVDNHLLDVKSSDQHTVKPWFRGKLPFSPTVRDLKEKGFELVGGRLEWIQGRSAAALVYRRRLHVINLLIWPAEETRTSGPVSESRQGYQMVHWRRDGMNWWAISDLNAEELAEFARLQGME